MRGAGNFEAIFRHGSRREGRYVQIVIAPAALPAGRVGFVVGRKSMRRAVDRNRLKRVLREFLRTARAELSPFDVVIRLKQRASRDTIADAAAEAIALIRQAIAR